MSLKAEQYYCTSDPLRFFKKEALDRYRTCNFFSDDMQKQITTSVNIGTANSCPVFEKIITDGDISLQRIGYASAYIIWQNHAIKIDDNQSINITIDGASFYVVSLQYGDYHRFDIFSEDESEELYRKILDLLYHKQNAFPKTDSIAFTSPTLITLENVRNRRTTKEIMDLKTGKTKKLMY